MKIVTKYYNKGGKLKILRDKNDEIVSRIRLKKLKNGKEFPCCDFNGKCTNIAYAKAYPFAMKNSKKKAGAIFVENIILNNKKD
ncbi:MAG: hypothetical protein NT076_04405 [Candidatus Pacearchaeota archaeon]|nr:hypothetical protein [Candidatus Pacearchaeota archaeon]